MAIKYTYSTNVLILTLLLVCYHTVFAQERVTQLQEVEILAEKLSKFGVGASITELDSTLLKNYGRQSLADVLATTSSVYLKQYGAGMLASISFRGTGAGHTNVRWNGLQVGYPFLGQADFSTIPMEFIGDVSLLHGSSSARYGTGAIGGLVNLTNKVPQQGLTASINQSVGSFGTTNTFLQLTKAGGKGYVRLAGLYNRSDNNFKVRYSSGEPLDRQTNANYGVKGGLLEAKYNLTERSSLQLNIQNTYTDRNLQPSIGAVSSDNQKDQNLWSSLEFTQVLAQGELSLNYGYLFDQINFNGSITDSYQHVLQGAISTDLKPWLAIEAGGNSTWVEVQTPNYTSGSANELRGGAFVSVTLSSGNRFETSINLRQSFVSGYAIPFTPSIGVAYKLYDFNHWDVKLRSQLSKGYKVPSLNDRFWVPGGNPELLPEESVNAEVGLDITKGKHFWANTTAYKMWVDNWILWLPQGAIWSPENKRKVEGNGAEFELGIKQTLGKAKVRYWLTYAYTKSTNVEALDVYDRSAGKQLPYVPLHNGNINAQFQVKGWSCLVNGKFTGRRFTTTDNESYVPGYVLINLRFSKHMQWEYWAAHAYINLNNLTNTNYQSVSNRAMPGINLLAGIKISLNKSKQ